MASLKKITTAFERLGYTKKMKVTENKFYQLLDELLGQPFDTAVAAQLWEQAASKFDTQAQIGQLIDIINKAQKILNDKNNQLSETIYNLEKRKKQIEDDPSIRPQHKSSQLKRINQQINQLKKDKEQFSQDLYLVTVPFGIKKQIGDVSSVYASKYTPQPKLTQPFNQKVDESGPQQNIKQLGHNTQLKYLLWITAGIAVLQLIMIYSKSDFLNLIVVFTILSIFLLNYFDAFYIKICLILTSISIILDIAWLILYASNYWNPPVVGVHTQSQAAFLRFIVFFTVFILILKLPISYFLFGFRNLSPDSNYSVSLVGKAKITLSANKRNIISQSINRNSNNNTN